MTRPIIGIVPAFDEGESSVWRDGVERIYLRHDYLDRITAAGAIPLILHPSIDLGSIVALCAGIVISGGEDIDPAFYGRPQAADTTTHEPRQRFEWECQLIDACDEAGVPILGVCYGMQRLNVHYGGTLLADIPTALPDNVGHSETVHAVTLQQPMLGLTGEHQVVSRHHQAVDDIADGFNVVAAAPDGIIEAIAGRGHFGVQWHTESDATGAQIYRAFVDYAVHRAQ